MANKYLDTAFVDKAIKFAVDAHSNTERRGKGFPYVIHTLEAMEIVATMTSDPELLAAAALHDTVEDTDVTVGQIRAEFGDRVASIVESESDKFIDGISEEDSWRIRKQAAIDRIENSSRDSKIVALGDKLSNMRAIARDYHKSGDSLWKIFHAPGGKSDHEWHYRGLATALRDLAGTEAYTEFVNLVEDVFGEPKFELVDMSHYTESGDGYTSLSYNHDGGKLMIKLYYDFIPEAVSVTELRKSWAIADMGLSIPKATRLVTDGKRKGVEFERIVNKKSYARAISHNPEKLGELSREFASFCRKLHSTPCKTDLFRDIADQFIEEIKHCKSFTQDEIDRMVRFIESLPRTTNCVHGDMHIGNALIADGKQYWIDLADFGYGNPMFDLGMLHFICFGFPSEEDMQRLYHVSCAQLKEIFEAFLCGYFGEDCDIEAKTAEIARFSALHMAKFDARGTMRPHMKAMVQQWLLDKIQ